MTYCRAGNEEDELICRAQLGNDEATEALMLSYRPLLYALAGRICSTAVSREELVQAGYIGLMLALRRFDEGQQVRFSTYAVPWVIGEMKKALKKSGWQTAAVSLDADWFAGCGQITDRLVGSKDIDLTGIDLRRALQNLKKEEQLLICLRYFRDKTQKETAGLLHKSQTQISRMERCALDQLHSMLS